ncbi:MAG: copper chaperone PCu(A)C [Rhodothermales bacterium]
MTGPFWNSRCYAVLLLITSILLGLAISGCQSENPADKALSVDAAWTRPYDAQAGISSTAVYLTIHNRTDEPARLISAHIVQSDTIEIHQSIQDNGIMRMKPTPSVLIEAQESLAFKPGGHHMMVKGLQRSLDVGDRLEITLGFANGHSIKTTALTMWDSE